MFLNLFRSFKNRILTFLRQKCAEILIESVVQYKANAILIIEGCMKFNNAWVVKTAKNSRFILNFLK